LIKKASQLTLPVIHSGALSLLEVAIDDDSLEGQILRSGGGFRWGVYRPVNTLLVVF
jgi:hypothetical protein